MPIAVQLLDLATRYLVQVDSTTAASAKLPFTRYRPQYLKPKPSADLNPNPQPIPEIEFAHIISGASEVIGSSHEAVSQNRLAGVLLWIVGQIRCLDLVVIFWA
jgi:hypothetical protein